ncbi:MAG: ATP-binding protein [Fibromonadales bacterium]|nr:ATP-binding protein [Fibromonadales bacterium]
MVAKYRRILSYWQVILVFLAFMLVIGASYILISNAEQKHLRRDAENVLDNTSIKIEADFTELKTLTNVISETVHKMIMKGEDYEKVSWYLKNSAEHISNYGKIFLQVTNIYGTFDVFEEKFHGENRIWYKAAVDANGGIAITEPYMDVALDMPIITYSRRIMDNKGNPLGIICIDVKLDKIKEYASDVHLTKGTYSILFNKQFEVIAHPSPSYLGKSLRKLNDGLSIESDLRQGISISERKVMDYKGNQSIAFIKQLENGWFLAILIPYKEYYESLSSMAEFLSALGFAMALTLSLLLSRITTTNNKLEKRMQSIFENSPFGNIMFDKNANIIECNMRVVKMFDLSSKQECVKRFIELSPKYQPNGRLSSDELAEVAAMAYEKGTCTFEWMHRKLDGENIPYEVTLVRTESGSDGILMSYMRDLRETRRMMDEIKNRGLLLNTVNKMASVLLQNHDENTFESALQKSLELMGQSLDVDRVQIYRNEVINDELHFVCRYKWLSEYGKRCVPVPIGLNFPYSRRQEWKKIFTRRENINSPTKELSPQEQDFLGAYNIKSIVIIPLFLDDEFWGFFNIDNCHTERKFSREEMEILTSAGFMMSHAISRNLQITRMREADEHLQIIFDNVPLGYLMVDKNYNVIECNQKAIKLFKLASKQECIDKFKELSPEFQPNGKSSRERIVALIDETFDKGFNQFEWMHQTLNGEPIPCEVMFVRVKYKDDVTIVGYIRDLRGLKTMLDELRKENENSNAMAHWYNSILNAIPLPVTVTDVNANWTFINTAVEKFLGITLKDAMGKSCSNWNSNICNTPDCGIECAKRGLEQTYFSKGDKSYQVDVAKLKDLSGETTGYIEVVQDITNLKSMAKKQAEAETANIAKSAFLAKMSHEIRTPMNAILGITEIQLEDENLSPTTLEALNKIYVSANLLLNIINDILDLSKAEVGKLELIPNKYDVASMIYDTVQLNIVQFSHKTIDFELDVDKNVPTELFGDELRIKQILNNLLTNAFKYTNKGKIKLLVSSERKDDDSNVMLIFNISDTGQGMTEDQKSKIFDEFARFNLEYNRAVQGAGLGMSIVKHLIQMMNGEISVESEIGKGTTVNVKVPQGLINDNVFGEELVQNLQNSRFIKDSQARSSRIEREPMPYGSVLIVDDVESNLFVAKCLLQPYKLSIDIAESGEEAVEKIRRGKVYDVVFMDQMMPKMDGVEAVKIMRDLGYSAPIIALTANAIVGQAEILLSSGFDDFISKPIDLRQMNYVLNKFIRDKQSEEVIAEARQKYNVSKINPYEIDLKANPDLLVAFVRDAKKKIPIMGDISKNIDTATNEDLHLFTINVHAIKSALANIGERVLSDVARKLEKAGTEGNRAVISSDTGLFLENLGEVIKRLESEKNATAPEKEDIVYLKAHLLEFRSACANYDKKYAKSILTELCSAQWSPKTEEFMDLLQELLLHSDFDEAVSKTTEFMESCK